MTRQPSFSSEAMLDGLKGKQLEDATGLEGTDLASKQRLVKRRMAKIAETAAARRSA